MEDDDKVQVLDAETCGSIRKVMKALFSGARHDPFPISALRGVLKYPLQHSDPGSCHSF